MYLDSSSTYNSRLERVSQLETNNKIGEVFFEIAASTSNVSSRIDANYSVLHFHSKRYFLKSAFRLDRTFRTGQKRHCLFGMS